MFVVPNVEQNKIRADQFHPRGWAVTRGRDVEFFVPADLSLIHHPFFAQELTGTLARLGGVEDGPLSRKAGSRFAGLSPLKRGTCKK